MKWLTPDDIAEMLQISRSYSYDLIKKFEKSGGYVWRPSKRVTRVKPDEFIKYLEKK